MFSVLFEDAGARYQAWGGGGAGCGNRVPYQRETLAVI